MDIDHTVLQGQDLPMYNLASIVARSEVYFGDCKLENSMYWAEGSILLLYGNQSLEEHY
jgi:hypothetical protein